MEANEQRPLTVVLDYETVEIVGKRTVASTEFYRPTFRVSSASFTWRGPSGSLVSVFREGEAAVRRVIEFLHARGAQFVTFNQQFEWGVTRYRYPDLVDKLRWHADAQRLVQNLDNGGDKAAFEWIPLGEDEDGEQEWGKEFRAGMGLAACVKRVLRRPDPKAATYAYLRDVCGVKAGKEGANLHLLPYEQMRAYNISDTENTLLLYEHCIETFRAIGFDWTLDHALYMGAARRLAAAKGRGISVDRAAAAAYAKDIEAQVADIERAFLDKFAEPIRGVERQLRLEAIRKRKTLKGRKNYLRKGKWREECAFNPGSNRQLALLFVDQLGIEPFFRTPKEGPSFKAAHLHQWGDGGKLLADRRKRLLIHQQTTKLLEKSEYDGRWHVDLRAVGTVTSRFAGSGGLNVQALGRRDKGLMSTLRADPGYTFVSIDASSGEPSVITEFTNDPMYRYFCFDGVGKAPFYRDAVLMIDDIYLAYASVCPMFSQEMYDLFEAGVFAGWVKDPEAVKAHPRVKKIRKDSKWITLAFGYGLGAGTLYKKAIEAGLKVTAKLCKQALDAYWDLFKGIKAYCGRLEREAERTGDVVNPFGYRFIPYELRKAFNGRVQSSISGLFNWYTDCVEKAAPYAELVTVIHDEAIYSVPEARLDEFRAALDEVAAHINRELNWSLKLRFGWAPGRTLYDAK